VMELLPLTPAFAATADHPTAVVRSARLSAMKLPPPRPQSRLLGLARGGLGGVLERLLPP
jgi:hypothetical protein